MGAVMASLLLKAPEEITRELLKYDVPLPPIMHKILTKSELGHNHIFVIGDVHGCLDELQTLVAHANHKAKGKCVFIFVGDLVNKGPRSQETLQYIRSMGDRAYAVRGNHDEHVVKNWLRIKAGEITTLKEKYLWLKDMTNSDIDYLLSLPYTITLPHLDVMIVHAGLDPFKTLDEQTPEVMTKIRGIMGPDTFDPAVPTTNANGGMAWGGLWAGPMHVYFGHDAQRGLQEYQFATGLDTGCVYGKKLTGKFLTGTRKIISVHAKDCYSTPTKQPRREFLIKDLESAPRDPNYKPAEFGVPMKHCTCDMANCECPADHCECAGDQCEHRDCVACGFWVR